MFSCVDYPLQIDYGFYSMKQSAVEQAVGPDPGERGLRVFERGLDEGPMLRVTGDVISLAPPFIASIDETRTPLRRALRAVAAA